MFIKKLLLLYVSTIFSSTQKLSLIIKPVADLVSEHSNLNNFNDISFSPVNKKDSLSCPRLHQVLFNEVVKIVSEDKASATVEITNAFYQKENDNKKLNRFKIDKYNLVTFEQLRKNNLDIEKIPAPINFNHKNISNNNVITLTTCFHDKITNNTYSAGTRFVLKKETDAFFCCYVLNPKTLKFDIIPIDKKACINSNTLNSFEKKKNFFLKILNEYANLAQKKFIPYVWGGCSYCNTFQEDFVQLNKQLKGRTISYYDYTIDNKNIKTGFDCSGMILRASQICNIPFYYKNSITILKNMRAIQNDEHVENGDIIWIPGHVMVITDVKKNLLIQSSDYSTGFGNLHEISLKKAFKNINNFQILKNVSLSGKKIKRLDKYGKDYQTINNLKILKLKSIYESNI